MRKLYFICFFSILLPYSLTAAPYTPQQLPATRIIEDFNNEPVNKFPSDFRTYPFQRDKADQVYAVQSEDGNSYLKALDDKDFSVQILRRFAWESTRWSYFSWRWRAKILPKGAAENDRATNDCACGIYVVFGGYDGNVIKYTWSSTLPTGTIVEKKPGQSYSVILESGPKNLGVWKIESVNVMDDYRRLFKTNPTKNPSGFGILTDGNATHTPSACDYDDFRISENPF